MILKTVGLRERMKENVSPLHGKAVFWLVAATAMWGISFPILKVLHLRHEDLGDTWLLSSWTLAARCIFTALILAAIRPAFLRSISKAEWMQSLGLTIFGGLGLIFQADGLAQTNASTSAFLTQFYCVILPLWACLKLRQWPSRKILICTILVLVGIAILSGLDFRTMQMGPGEWKTLIASCFFTGQILILEQPKYGENRGGTITILCMAGTGLIATSLAIPITKDYGAFFSIWMAWPDLILLAILTLGCTLFSYLMMNQWQKRVSATEAGLIYCLEPVFTSVYVLFLPSLLGVWAGVKYENEALTTSLIVGGTLVTVANLLLQLPERKRPTEG